MRNPSEILSNLRSLFKNVSLIKEEISAYIISHSDAHQVNLLISNSRMNISQIVTVVSNLLQILLDQTIISSSEIIHLSKCLAIVTDKFAAFWTDGRYHLQADQQLDLKHWIVMKEGLENVPTKSEWLQSVLEPASKVGIDPNLVSISGWKAWEKSLHQKNLKLTAVMPNLVDLIWGAERPSRPQNPVFALDIEYTGMSWPDKVYLIADILKGHRNSKGEIINNNYDNKQQGEELNSEILKNGLTVKNFKRKTLKKCDSYLITALDEICWTFNLRGSDIEFNPVFFSYALVNCKSSDTIIKNEKICANNQTEPQTGYPPIEVILFYGENEDQTQHLYRELEKQALDQLYSKLNPSGKIVLKIFPYADIYKYLGGINWTLMGSDYKIWLSPQSNYALANLIPNEIAQNFTTKNNNKISINHLYCEEISPILNLKSIKTDAEIQGSKLAHFIDAITLCEFFAWINEQLNSKNSQTQNGKITEISAAQKLLEIRMSYCNNNNHFHVNNQSLPAKSADFQLKPVNAFRGLSFETISSVGPNSAIIHYKPMPETDRELTLNEVFLCDSGSQYLFGTTDVTRTLYFGPKNSLNKEIRQNYTLVLKGHLACMRAIFPRGIKGYRLDCLARMFLWEYGLDFLHGTGHGVGAYLNVHEGPEYIGTRASAYDTDSIGLQPNSLMTIEPGYYISQTAASSETKSTNNEQNYSKSYGIRIENTCMVKPIKTLNNFNGTPYLTFESLTLVPYDPKLIDATMLTNQEILQINEYHTKIFETLAPELERLNKTATLNWLKEQTQPIS